EQPPALVRSARRSREPLVQVEHLVGGVPTGEAEELGQVPERAAGGARPGPRTDDGRLSPARPHEPDEDLDERRLPCPVPPEQADELALLDNKVDALQRLDRAVALPEPADGKRIGHAPRLLGKIPAKS